MALFSRAARNADRRVMPNGWQVYFRPTALEPVGTIFRIDGEGRRYIVDELPLETMKGEVAAARIEEQVQTSGGVIARLLGLSPFSAGAEAGRVEQTIFNLRDPVHEYATDAVVDRALAPALKSINYRADNRYFLIRECRWASGMTYRVSSSWVADLGGEARVTDSLGAGAKLKLLNASLYEIEHDFAQPLRVMYLPDEIKPVSAGLAGAAPELGRVPVAYPLVWVD